MTVEEFLSLPPNDQNALVEENLNGEFWKPDLGITRCLVCYGYFSEKGCRSDWCAVKACKPSEYQHVNYVSCFEETLLVIEKICARGHEVSFRVTGGEGSLRWSARINGFSVEGQESIGMAFCIVALQVVGVLKKPVEP